MTSANQKIGKNRFNYKKGHNSSVLWLAYKKNRDKRSIGGIKKIEFWLNTDLLHRPECVGVRKLMSRAHFGKKYLTWVGS